jgi:putative tryptophan/tyrosine transport system substrate-binding protein
MSGMRRREFVILLGGSAAAAWPLAAHAQQSNRLRVVGVLLAMAPDDPEAQLRVKAFEAGLRELGWTEGRNLRLEYRWAAGDAALLRKQATELVGLAPDLILATSTPVLAALRQENPLPIVFVQVTDPIGGGFVPNLARPGDASLSRPGANVTGAVFFAGAVGAKRLELLRQLVPGASTIAMLVLAQATNPAWPQPPETSTHPSRPGGTLFIVLAVMLG